MRTQRIAESAKDTYQECAFLHSVGRKFTRLQGRTPVPRYTPPHPQSSHARTHSSSARGRNEGCWEKLTAVSKARSEPCGMLKRKSNKADVIHPINLEKYFLLWQDRFKSAGRLPHPQGVEYCLGVVAQCPFPRSSNVFWPGCLDIPGPAQPPSGAAAKKSAPRAVQLVRIVANKAATNAFTSENAIDSTPRAFIAQDPRTPSRQSVHCAHSESTPSETDLPNKAGP